MGSALLKLNEPPLELDELPLEFEFEFDEEHAASAAAVPAPSTPSAALRRVTINDDIVFFFLSYVPHSERIRHKSSEAKKPQPLQKQRFLFFEIPGRADALDDELEDEALDDDEFAENEPPVYFRAMRRAGAFQRCIPALPIFLRLQKAPQDRRNLVGL